MDDLKKKKSKEMENLGEQPKFLPGNFSRAAKNKTGRADQADALWPK